MGRKPYKFPAAAAPASSPSERAAPAPGSLILQANATGGPLPDPATSEAQRQGHTPAIPWPKAGPVTNKPTK